MPIRLTRIYTRTGDKGDTGLVGGRRVAKDSPRIEAYGTVDELNAIIGLARVFNAERLKKGKAHRWLDGIFRRIQNELFDLGSELATPDDAVYEGMHRVGEPEVKALETLMDQCQKDLQPLKSFTLPGGGRGGGQARAGRVPRPHRRHAGCRRPRSRHRALAGRVRWPCGRVAPGDGRSEGGGGHGGRARARARSGRAQAHVAASDRPRPGAGPGAPRHVSR